MVMSGMLSRAQLGRVTRWVQTRYPSPFSIIQFKKCSSTSDPPPSSEKNKGLPEHIAHLTCHSSADSGYCQVYLVGTVHVSQKSCAHVQEIISVLKPEVVFLELCARRQAILKSRQLKEPSMEEIVAMILKKPNPLGLLISLFYSKLARELKVVPGSEFRVAYEEAIKYGGKVVIGDRPIQITLARAWRKMPLSEKINLLLPNPFRKRSWRMNQLLRKMIEELDSGLFNIDMEMVTFLTQELGEISPTLVETIIHERDQYMSAALLLEASKCNCIVAVVGMAHLEGIKKHWKQYVSVKDLLTVPPPPKPIMSTIVLTFVSVAMAGVAMMWGYL